MSESIDVQNLTFSVPAKVLRPAQQRAADLLVIAREKHALDADVLEGASPFFWSAEISSDLVDSHHSHMMPSTLENFRQDAIAGVSFLPGHRHYDLPFGRSLDAVLEAASDPNRTRVVADFYTVPGLRLNDTNTDDLIKGIRSGILRDVSVGFHGGEMRCDLCGRDYFSWDCEHVAGMRYETKGTDGVIRVVQATYAIDGARLAEVSAVFDGSTPKAEIIKARREAAEGRMRPEAIRIFEEQYRIKLPEPAKQYRGAKPQEDKSEMDHEKIVIEMRKAFALGEDGDLVAEATRIAAEVGKVEALQQDRDAVGEKLAAAEAKIAELEPRAKEGQQYRTDLIAEALAEGVRALGDKFDTGTYKRTLEALDLDAIKRMRDDWRRVGDSRFPGGRASTNEGEPAPSGEKRRTNRLPDKAFAV